MSTSKPPTRIGLDPLRVAIYARRSASGGTSAEDQVRMGQEDAEREGWTVVAVHSESGQSASMYRKDGRPRAEWAEIQTLVTSGAVDLIWVRETSRADRRMATWAPFLELLRTTGVRLYVRNDRRVYHIAEWRDHKTLLEDGIDNASESARKADSVKQGIDDNVRRGLPVGAAPLGYRNLYDDRRKLAGREPDPQWRGVAVEMFVRVGRGDSLANVAEWLNGRGAPLRGGGRWRTVDASGKEVPRDPSLHVRRWSQTSVRAACEDRSYLAERVHTFDGDAAPTIVTMGWTPLVTREQWNATRRALAAIEETYNHRGRTPGAYRHLLSNIAACHQGCPIGPGWARGTRVYTCANSTPGYHITINHEDLDAYVTALVIHRMARGDLFAALAMAGGDDIARAQSDVAELESEIALLRGDVGRRKGQARLAVVDAIAALELDLEAARTRQDGLQVHPAVGDLARAYPGGVEALEKVWGGMLVPARRDVIRLLLPELVILPAPLVLNADGSPAISSRTGRPYRSRAVRGAVDPRRVRHRFIGEAERGPDNT